MKNPLVSIIVPTFNSGQFLELCLESIRRQTYKNIELIVVDRNSTDNTKEIARRYTNKIFDKEPERSAQVNFGVTKAAGEYVYKVDSDFVLDPNVVTECVEEASRGFDAVVVHNSPDVRISWIAKIRKFEVDMYKYDLMHSSARFVRKDVYQAIGGFNESITAGEDYDFQNKLNRAGFKTGFIDAEALHLGEPTAFWRHMKKNYSYGKDAAHYRKDNPQEFNGQLKFILLVWLKQWRKFVRRPLAGASLLAYYFFKFSFAGTGLIVGNLKQKEQLHQSRKT
jgi:glycosyltransferase involved in cell wall biosynthesis